VERVIWNSPHAKSNAFPMTVQRLVADVREVCNCALQIKAERKQFSQQQQNNNETRPLIFE
jgi:hypothetical protein